jgi:hypothetical protein
MQGIHNYLFARISGLRTPPDTCKSPRLARVETTLQGNLQGWSQCCTLGIDNVKDEYDPNRIQVGAHRPYSPVRVAGQEGWAFGSPWNEYSACPKSETCKPAGRYPFGKPLVYPQQRSPASTRRQWFGISQRFGLPTARTRAPRRSLPHRASGPLRSVRCCWPDAPFSERAPSFRVARSSRTIA